jgi:hypothetical protein
VVVAAGNGPEPAKKIQDLPAILSDIIQALSRIDEDFVESQKLHEMELTGIHEFAKQLRRLGRSQAFCIFHRQQFFLCCHFPVFTP